MRFSLFLPPLGAIAISAVLLIAQNRSIATMDESSDVIAGAITSSKSDSTGGTATPIPSMRAVKVVYLHEGKPDWAAISERLRVMRESEQNFDLRMKNEIEGAMEAMTGQQLLAALDEIDALDLPRSRSDEIASMPSGELAKKDPAALLTRAANRGEARFRFDSTRMEALRNWIGKDADAAIAWGDGMKQAGRFALRMLDGKQPVLIQYEASVVKALEDQGDLAGAARRKAALPESLQPDLEQELNKPVAR